MKRLLRLLFLFFPTLLIAQIGINQPADIVICSSLGFESVNLSAQSPAVLGALNPASYSVTYHTTLVDANAGTEAIANPSSYMNADNPEDIFVRVEEIANPAVFEVASFNIILNSNPGVFDQTFTTCDFDENPDGLTLIDLEEVAEAVYGGSGIIPTEVELTFYLTEADAQNQINGLESPFEMTLQNQGIYVRAMTYATGCVSVAIVTITANDCSGQCVAPTNLQVSNVTGTSATFSWTASGSETEWEILVLFSGGPFPLPTMDGIIVDTNPATITGLECPESFDVYIRAVCTAQISNWSTPLLLLNNNCSGGGDPVDLSACPSGGNACFDLTVNDNPVLGTLNPLDYTITYHTSAAAATAGTGAIANPAAYCISDAIPSAVIYVRLENIDSGGFTTFEFTISSQNGAGPGISLPSMIACDDDQDGDIVFNLASAGAIIGTQNVLSYYASSAGAISQTGAIPDPAAYILPNANFTTTIYIREAVDGCDLIHSVEINALVNCNFSNICAGANSLCNALGTPFANTTGITSAEAGNNYGCLDENPDPTWFYLPVSAAGDISLLIEQSSSISFAEADLDTDFVAFGPFTDPLTPCDSQLTSAMVIDCSYSGSLTETVTIPNALPGQYYLIMATNYTDQPGYFRITETAGSQGGIDCTGFRLNAFIDTNANGVKDGAEINFPLGKFRYNIDGSSEIHNIIAPGGIHQIYDVNPSNLYSLTFLIDAEYVPYYSVATPSYTGASIVVGSGLQDYNFPVTATQDYNDLGIAIVPNDAPMPGFSYTNTIIYSNFGSQAATTGTIVFMKDPRVIIISVSEAGAVNEAAGFSFAFSNLLPFETRTITVTMLAPTIPTIALGDFLTNTVMISSGGGDIELKNNNAVAAQEIIGSFDPNDKMESRGPQILTADFTSDDRLYYTVRFQNTGTSPAINIRVSDTLDGRLDESSVQMIRASHDYTLDRVDNQLTWRFTNILLPETASDPTASHGYVMFSVKPDAGYATGDIIANTASIFFDFNPAIVTNTFTTEFVDQLGITDFTADIFAMYPNPADEMLTIRSKESLDSIIVYDLLGHAIIKRSINGNAETLDISALTSGMYLVEVKTLNSGNAVKKLFVN